MLIVACLFVIGLILLSYWYVNFRINFDWGCGTLIAGILVVLLSVVSLLFIVSSHLGLMFISLIGLIVVLLVCCGSENG
jgi:hypothetical protein